jgi:D-sedoheptulose 7-phosphate isomerase
MSFPASYPASYREQLLSTVGSIDTGRVAQAIQWMTAARDAGRSIFVAGNGGSAATAAHFVGDTIPAPDNEPPGHGSLN